jgi:hypothetical protein
MEICVEQRGTGRGFPHDTASIMEICVEQRGTGIGFPQDTASIMEICVERRGTARGFPQDTSIWSFGIIPPMLHTHLSAAVIRRTCVPNLKSPNKAIDLPQMRRIAKKVSFILTLILLMWRI